MENTVNKMTEAKDNIQYNSLAQQLRLIADARIKQDKEDLVKITKQAATAANEGKFQMTWYEYVSKWVWNKLTEMDFDLEEKVANDSAKTREVIIRW